MAGVEDDPVARGVEHPVDRQRQLDDAEVGSQVASGLGDLGDQESADLLRQLGQLRVVEAT